MKLEGTSALVTGASRGLGAALARRLAERGARVVGVARGRDALEAVVDSIRARGHEAHALVADVGDKSAIHRIAGAAAELAGPVDLLVHNASELGPTPLRLLLDTECEDLSRVLEVNLLGPFRLTRAVAGSMALGGGGLVVHLSSDAAVNAYPTWGAYSLSKAALDHLTRLWAVELAELGVRVLSVDPGDMDTAMHAAAIPDADPSGLADPGVVAQRLVELIEKNDGFESGSRVELGLEGAA